MCWQWARSSCAIAVVSPVKRHGQVQDSGSAQPSSTIPKGTLADLPRGTNTAILALVKKKTLCNSCQLLLFHREPDSPKSVFVLGFIFCSRIGCNTGAHIPPHSQHREPVSTPSVCPMPSQGRTKGTPHHHAGNSPEPSGPRSVRGRTGREPRGTVNSSTPSPPRLRPLAPHPRLHGAHTPWSAAWYRLCTIQHGAGSNPSPPSQISPPARPQPAPTTTAPNSPAACALAGHPLPAQVVSQQSCRHSPGDASAPSRSAR